jgi:hypothetical protein
MADFPEGSTDLTGFEWHDGNSEKNWRTHGIARAEAEQVFFNRPVLVAGDLKHAQSEPRFLLLGRTDADRLLFVASTVRGPRVRVISARAMSRRERRWYGKALETEAEADS